MAIVDILNSNTNLAEEQAVSLESVSMRELFVCWLANGNAKKYPSEALLACMEKISGYALQKKISYVNFWEYTKPNAFKPVFNRLLNTKLLRITDNDTYKIFQVAGPLYIKFLKEKPFSRKTSVPVVKNEKAEKQAFISQSLQYSTITVDNFVDWLTAQNAANGKVLLKHEAQRYANNICSASSQLDIPLTLTEREVFSCQSIEEFDCLCEIFRSAPNYRVVNWRYDQGAFSEGLEAFRRYLEYLAKHTVGKNGKNGAIVAKEQATITSTEQQNPDLWRVDFARPEQCAFTDPVECIILGQTLRELNWNWRDLLIVVTEHFLKIDNTKVQSFVLPKGRLFMTEQKPANSECRQLSNRMFVVVSLNIPNLVRTIGKLCAHCGVEYSDITITYTNKETLSHKQNRINSSNCREKLAKAPSITVSTSVFSGIIDFEDGRDSIRNIITKHFQSLYGYSNINILWDAAQNQLSMFLNDNAINTADDFWRFLCHVFDKEFILNRPHIWQTIPTYPQGVRGLVINLARQHGGMVTREQINDFFIRIKVISPANNVVLEQGELLFCGSNKFIATESINLTAERCKAISAALSDLFTFENTPYIIPRDIRQEWFARLPELPSGIGWTSLLLQEVLRVCTNIGYSVILPNLKGQKYDTLGAAIVPCNSDIITFADVVHRYCYVQCKFPYDILAEDLRIGLRNAGMVEGNELIYNMHKALKDHRFAFDSEKKKIKILER